MILMFLAAAAAALLGNSSLVAVKWPNDVLVGGKKICGELAICDMREN